MDIITSIRFRIDNDRKDGRASKKCDHLDVDHPFIALNKGNNVTARSVNFTSTNYDWENTGAKEYS